MKFDLVFEGGGAKGMAFVGACDALYGAGHSHGRLLGTSAGAITAVLLAAGFTPAEMSDALGETNAAGEPVFQEFMGAPREFVAQELEQGALATLLENLDFKLIPDWIERRIGRQLVSTMASHARARHVVALVERGGWFGADRFVTWFADKLDDKTPVAEGGLSFSQMTLEQFHRATGVEVSVVAADTHDGSMLILNHQTAPGCPVVWAVRMSMSIPFMWDEVIWQKEWGAYRGRDLTGHAVVDGGMLSNFPIELFLSAEASVTSVMGPKGGDPVLGFLLDETLEVPLVTRGLFVDVNIKPTELATVRRLMRIVDTMTGAHDKRVMEANSECIVRLPAKGYGTTEFAMTPVRRAALVDAARAATRAHFDKGTSRSFAPAATRSGTGGGATDRIARSLLSE